MKPTAKDILAVTIVVSALVASLMTSLSSWVDPGIHLAYQDGQVVVTSVDFGSSAQRDGMTPQMVVTQLNDVEVLTASDDVKRQIAAAYHITSISVIPSYLVADLLAERAQAKAYAEAEAASIGIPLDQYGYPIPSGQYYWYWRGTWGSEFGFVLFGLAILALGWWWLAAGKAGQRLRPYALTLPVAISMPFVTSPFINFPNLWAFFLSPVLLALGMVPLALDFAGGLSTRRARALGALAVIVLCAVAIAAGLAVPVATGSPPVYRLLQAGCLGLITLVPGLWAAGPRDWREAAGSASAAKSAKFVESTELGLAAVTPGIACLSLTHGAWPLVLWLGGIVAVRRLTLAPLLKAVSRTRYQRDLVVQATESERARIAGDIHDYALQDLTMLVRRLDAAGDKDNAEAAREVADRLRVICGDLRLPILDDLGVGPAIEWLIARYEPNVGKIGLDRLDDERRLPDDIELAFFRVAQEAIANAAKHGRQPIRVRYRGGGDWAELEVDDAGPGLAPGAAEQAERTGHLGLMSMSQRSEAIGAELSVGRRPGGGTRVKLAWEAATVPTTSVAGPVPAAGAASAEPA